MFQWKTIVCSAVCCCNRKPRSAMALSASGATGLAKYQHVHENSLIYLSNRIQLFILEYITG